MTTGSRSW